MYFRNIAIMGLPRKGNSYKQTINRLIRFLWQYDCTIYVESRITQVYHLTGVASIDNDVIGQVADLAIVVGGDGSIIGAARDLARHGVPVIGVNRGHLGFLTDLKPANFESDLAEVLDGLFVTEKRPLIDVSVVEDGIILETHSCLNEAVIHPKQVAHMIEFEVFIDDKFMNSMKSDGLIVSTPTGSTAYALSAGGPIMNPDINAFCLIPMFPHTLSNRPIVISDTHEVSVDFLGDESSNVTIDGQKTVNVTPHQKVLIRKSSTELTLIHLKSYSYYHVLREKLGWGSKLF
ncbi:MAG: NAD(+) kinase [Succinivibrionaceae bacterium]|nr:NAD(+) kinase [Succinivibrionaceae bacterium]